MNDYNQGFQNPNPRRKAGGKTWLWVLLAVLVVLVFWGVSGYNGFVKKQEVAYTELSNVQTAYQRRADLLPQLAKIVKSYATHERETFTQVTQARASATQMSIDPTNLTADKLRQYTEAQGELSAALGRLMVVAERYPELKASENYKSLQIQVEGTENRIQEARRKYNDAVQAYNISVRRMPAVILANLFGFDVMPKFEAAQGAEKAPDLDI